MRSGRAAEPGKGANDHHAHPKDNGEGNACERPQYRGPGEGTQVRWRSIAQGGHRSKAAIHQHEDEADPEGARKSMRLRLLRRIRLAFLAQDERQIWMSFTFLRGHRLCVHPYRFWLNGLQTGPDRQDVRRQRVLPGEEMILPLWTASTHQEAPLLGVFA
jgi:hypothetical protein